jgi:hypothetical protein
MSAEREPLHEWTDPLTEEPHSCPASFMAIAAHLGRGESTALPALVLLRKLDKPPSDANLRHLRKAVFLLQRALGVPVVSTRSSAGGYYIARTVEELEQHCELQEKLARSMVAGVDALRAAFHRQPPPPPRPRRRPTPEPGPDLFA